MAYNYLLELYEIIMQRRREAQRSTETTAEHQQGRVDVLDEFERFLRDSYHGRLPRRIRQRAEVPGENKSTDD